MPKIGKRIDGKPLVLQAWEDRHLIDIKTAHLLLQCEIKVQYCASNMYFIRAHACSVFAGSVAAFWGCLCLFLNKWLFLDAQWKHEVLDNRREGEACLVYFPRLPVRKVLFSTLWPSYSPFLGKSETKSREAVAGKEKATGKWTLGRTEGECPHSKERSRSFLGWHGGTQALAGRLKKKVRRGLMSSHLVAFLSSFTTFPPPQRCPKSHLQSNLAADSAGMQS